MKFPYGISDFYKIITGDYFYVDRTGRIELLEKAGEQLLFLRPRRFGKSLLLSMLENYYDIAKADEFERLFGHLAIGQDPTPLHNQYFVLAWDFSVVSPQGEAKDIEQSLHRYLNARIQNFAVNYRHLLPIDIRIEPMDALVSFQSVLTAVQQSPYRLYLLIDEYDNFANEVMMASHHPASKERYETLLYGEGALKTVFKAVKAAGAGRGLDRVFITGVSPIVLSDVTSGYNIAKNIYLKPQFSDLCGFWESEVKETLYKIVAACNLPDGQADEALIMMRTFYNGYRFAYNQEELVYNPTLVLYFMEHFQETCQYPRQMLDDNLAMDQSKITYISQLPGGVQLILDTLNEEQPLTIEQLATRFGVEEMFYRTGSDAFKISLLYYLGVLTLGGQTPFGELILKIPNLVGRRLYIERIQEILLPDAREQDEGRRAARTLYQTGNMQPLCDFIEQRYFKVFDNRDYRWANELTVKTAFLTLLFNDLFYIMDSESALERSYSDLTMIIRPGMRQYKLLDILIEFKYVSLTEVGSSGEEVRGLSLDELKVLTPVQRKLAESKSKLEGYQDVLASTYGDLLRLHSYSVVSVGFERLVWVEII